MRSDARLRREAILDAARRLFADVGLNVAMETIAEAGSVGVGTLYRNFSSRNELIRAVLLRTFEDIAAAAQQALAQFPQQPAEAWAALLRRLAGLHLGVLGQGLGYLDVQSRESLAASRQEANQLAAQVLALAAQAGLASRELTVRDLLLGIGSVSRPLANGSLPCFEEQEQRLMQILFAGFEAFENASPDSGPASPEPAGTSPR